MSGRFRAPARIACLALAAYASAALALDPRDIVFACPCSAEWVAGESGGPGTLTLHAGVRSHRATESGEVRWAGFDASGFWGIWDGNGGAVVGRVSARDSLRGEWTIALDGLNTKGFFEVHLVEQVGRDAQGEAEWHRHEKLALWPVPARDGVQPERYVDILTDTDGDGVGDVNERLAGTAWDDPASTPGESVVDVLALFAAEFRDAEDGYPYTRMQHVLSVTSAVFEDSDTNIRLRTVGMSEVELVEGGQALAEPRDALMESHGADVSLQFGPDGVCSGAGGCARVGAAWGTRWSYRFAGIRGSVSALIAAHELGHVMGLVHSALQGETHGAWRWSRGHHVTPRGESRALGTIMTYANEWVMDGVFSSPLTDCGWDRCGVDRNERDGADAVQSLDRLRFQIAAHRAPAADSDGDGFVDAADAAPDDPGDWLDIDGDGIGDNADPDDDNDGTPDEDDVFPFNPDEWADIDRDGIGDNADDDVPDPSPFRDLALRTAVEEALDKAAGAPITAGEMASLTELDAWRRDIRDLTGLELATGLGMLLLGSNQIRELAPLAELTGLRVLDLVDNPVEDITALSGLTTLEKLSLSDTRVNVADVLGLPYLNSLSHLGVGGLGLSDLTPLSALTELRSLNLRDNAIDDIDPLKGLVNLEGLFLQGNRVTDVSPLTGMTGLRYLYLQDNAIDDIGPLKGLVNLEGLGLIFNRIADVSPLSAMTGLRSLYLHSNAIDDIDPLKGLVNLEWLGLAGNRIADVTPLNGLVNVRWLDLSRNRISNIGPLVDRSIFGGADAAGAWVGLDRNPLDEKSIEEHVPTLESWGIEVNFRVPSGTEVSVVDPTLRAAIAETLAGGAVGVDSDSSDWPINGLRRLRLRGRGVTSLAGLEAASNLLSIWAGSNRISDLGPLAGLPELTDLDLHDNRISDLAPLVENADFADGDSLVLDGNPLNEDSLNTHVPALIERGVDVSVGSVLLSVVAGGNAVRFDVSGYFEAILGAVATLTVSVDDSAVAAATMDGGVLVLTPGAYAGHMTATVTAETGAGETEALEFLVTVRGPWMAPFVPRAADPVRQGFVRIVNDGARAADVSIVAIDDAGTRYPPASLVVERGRAVHFNSQDLETGNASKGLTGSTGEGTGDWRLEIESTEELKVASYIRTSDGFLTAMHDTAERRESGYFVPVFNPASNANQVSSLRLTNLDGEPREATITGVDDRGESPGDEVRVDIAAGATVTLPATDLEKGTGIGQGALGDGGGKWRLNVASDGELAVVSLLASPEGHLTNLSAGAPSSQLDDRVHTVPLFPSASDALGRQGFVRVIDRSGQGARVRIRPYDDSGRSHELLTLEVGAGQAAHFNSDDLELGNAGKGLEGSTGSGEGGWRLEFSSGRDIEVLAYVRTPGGFLTAMHNVVDPRGRRYDVVTFNPGSNTAQASRLRIVNPGSRPAHLSVAGIDDAGASPGEVLRVSVPAEEAVTLTAARLESGGGGSRGSLGDGSGKWRLHVDSEQPVIVMSLLSSPTGHLTNLSTTGGH